MKNLKTRYCAEYSHLCRCVNLWIAREDDKLARFIWEDMSPGSHSEPSAQLTDTQAQELMDQLWTCGFRPTEGRGSAGALTAVQHHLDDFRAIIRKTLDVNLP